MNGSFDPLARYPELLRRSAAQVLSSGDADIEPGTVLLAYAAARVLIGVDAAAAGFADELPETAGALQEVLMQGEMISTPAPNRERRPVYLPWAMGLVFRAARVAGLGRDEHEPLARLGEALHRRLADQATADYESLEASGATLCEALALAEAATWTGEAAWLELVQWRVHTVLSRSGENGELQPIAEGESLDAWTYRELVGMHTLHHLAALLSHRAWQLRVRQAVMFHLGHTQPDNTTTQPWALAAFLRSPGDASGVGFADQQLHDAMMQGGGTFHPMAAMLVADAAEAMA